MGINRELVYEINNEIERAKAKWGEIDKDPHELLNGVTEELLEVVHAVNHREGSAKVHEEIVHAIGVLVRLDEMAGNVTSKSSRPDDACSDYHTKAKQQGWFICPYCDKKLSGCNNKDCGLR